MRLIWCSVTAHTPSSSEDGAAAPATASADLRQGAPGIHRAHRVFPSVFDMLPGGAPDQQPDFDDEAKFNRTMNTARDADIATITLGEWHNMIGENASRSSFAFSGRQSDLPEAIVGTGTPVALLVMNDRPLDRPSEVEHVSAILDIWYPGTHGGHAVANLLFGDVSTAGERPFRWLRSVCQVSMMYSHTI